MRSMRRRILKLAAAAAVALSAFGVTAVRAEPVGGEAPEGAPWTAQRAVARALATSPAIRSAQAAVDEARAVRDERGRQFAPQIDVRASYTRLSPVQQGELIKPDEVANQRYRQRVLAIDDPETRAAFTALSNTFTDTTLPVVLNQYRVQGALSLPLTQWFFAVWPNYRAARGFERARRYEVEAERAAVALQTRQVFYEWLGAEAALEVVEASQTTVDAQRAQTEVLVVGGVLMPLEALRMAARAAQAAVEVSRARGHVEALKRALHVLLHLPSEAPLLAAQLAEAPLPPPRPPLPQLEVQALQERPDVRALQTVIAADGYAERAAGADAYPQLSLQGNLIYANPNPRVFPQEDAFDVLWDAGAVVSWSPNAVARSRAQVQQLGARRARARADLATLTDEVRSELSVRLSELLASRATLDTSLLAEQAAEESLRVLSDQFRSGTRLVTELIEAEQALTAARVDRVRSRVAVQLADARIQYALGRP